MQRAFNQNYFPLLNLIDGSIEILQVFSGILIGAIAAFVIDWKVFILVIVTAIPTFVIEVKYGGQVWHLFAKNSPEQRRSQDLRRSLYSVVATIIAGAGLFIGTGMVIQNAIAGAIAICFRYF